MKEKFNLLLVDDDANLAEMVREYLSLSGLYHVDRAENIGQLWERLGENQYDLMLLDYRLPDGNGLQALSELPTRGYSLPVVMFTGEGDERLAVRAMQGGASNYIVKGNDCLPSLPKLINETIQEHKLKLAIQQSEERVRYQALLLNNVSDAIVVWNLDDKITYWNPAAEALFGWKASALIGQSANESYLSKFTPSVRVPDLEDTGGYEVERRYHFDGKEIWVSSRLSVLRDYGADGRFIGYIDVSRDISERKGMEQALQRSETKTQAILDAIPDFIFRIHRDGTLLDFHIPKESPSVLFDPSLILNKNLFEHIINKQIKTPDSCEDGENYIERAFATRETQTFEFPFQLMGLQWEFEGRVSVSSPDEALIIVRDITSRKQMETQIKAAQTHMLQATRLSAIGELASGVAHQISNPLTTIIADSQLLEKSLPNDHPGRESVEAIQRAGWRAQAFVNKLIDFSKAPSNTYETISVKQTIEDALDLVRTSIEAAGVMLHPELADEALPIQGNAQQLQDLWVNLLLLSRDACVSAGSQTVKISTQSIANKWVEVAVNDDGEVILPERMDSIFVPNFLNTNSTRGASMELGICREIVHQHSGEIFAESNTDRGTTITVRFPMEAHS